MELCFLWCLTIGFNVNTGYFMIKHIVKIGGASRGHIVISRLITPIVVYFDLDLMGIKKAIGPR